MARGVVVELPLSTFLQATIRLRCIAASLAVTFVFACTSTFALDSAPVWRADHHMHLASVDLCRRVGECLDTNSPPAVYADDAVRALDRAGVGRGVVLSCAYLYGLRSLALGPDEIATLTRLENEFTATEVDRFPDRLVGFLSVDPLQDSALAEIEHWRGSTALRGLKLHLTASSVDLNREQDRQRLSSVIAAAAAQQLPIAIHLGGGGFGKREGELFIREVLAHSGESWVQIAHATGGEPIVPANHIDVLRLFADHVVRGDPVTQRVLFDLSFVPFAGEDAAVVGELRSEIRRIGIERFLFGSDFNVETPEVALVRMRSLGLTEEELARIAGACAPWAC